MCVSLQFTICTRFQIIFWVEIYCFGIPIDSAILYFHICRRFLRFNEFTAEQNVIARIDIIIIVNTKQYVHTHLYICIDEKPNWNGRKGVRQSE